MQHTQGSTSRGTQFEMTQTERPMTPIERGVARAHSLTFALVRNFSVFLYEISQMHMCMFLCVMYVNSGSEGERYSGNLRTLT